MNFKKGLITLAIIDLLFIGIFALYIGSSKYYGYNLIGIVEIILLIATVIALFLFVKSSIKNIKTKEILLVIAYIVSLLVQIYSVFIWIVFMP